MPGGGDDPVECALEELAGLGQRDAALGPLTTYRVGGPATILVEPPTVDDLGRVRAAHLRSGLPVLVVGRGSNLLVADRGVRAIVVGTGALEATIEIDADRARVVAGGGVSLPVLARRTAAAGLTGLEWAVGVPGSVGGAVRMNAGGHGSDVAACLVEATVADRDRRSRAGLPAQRVARRTDRRRCLLPARDR
jgi:UDP-N-acetylmuramate dehydrogenase